MVKRSSDEPADKAGERLRQFSEAREPVPEEGSKKESDDCNEEHKDDTKKSNQKPTNKNKKI